jgi:gentisate 1,2-dioxygenase
MASNGENAMFMQRMEDSSLRQLWRLTHVPHQRPEAGRVPKEMLKMKIDPTMCMKTKERVTKWTTICRAFWLKMHGLRGNSG